MLMCYNRGCGQEYDPEKNTEESCLYHPGEPYFHDAYKGWTCCNKKSVDFTEFLNMKGCTITAHSNVKPPEPVNSKKAVKIDDESKKKDNIVKPRRLERSSFDSPTIIIKPSIMPSLKKAIDELIPTLSKQRIVNDIKGEIEVGTNCKHGGCSAVYTSSESEEASCQYHPGVPIFHEGMKYWSCCQKKTSDFTTFMNQKGCTTGYHVWIKENDSTVVNCRYDWHQTGTDVTVAIYAKLYHYEKSKISLNPIRLSVELVFPQQYDAKFNLDIELRGIVKFEETTVKMYGTKVEIVMPKAEAGSWARLDFPRTEKSANIFNNENLEQNKAEGAEKSDNESDVDLDDVEAINMGARLVNLA